MPGKRNLIKLLFLLQTAYCWYCYAKACSLSYDDNYGLILQAIIISLVFVGLLKALYVWRRGWLGDKKWWVIIWILIGSPFPLTLGLLVYSELFGHLST